MAVELGRTWCVRHATYDSLVFLGSSGGAAMLGRDARARRQTPPRATLRRSLGLRRGNCAGKRLDLIDEGGRRLSVDGRGRDGLNSP